MYKLYLWYPWNFGRWIYKDEFATKKELYEQIPNKREATYLVIKGNDIVDYHEAANYCWRYGMVRPRPMKIEVT